MQRAGLLSLAFFYCDFRQYEKQDLRELVSSLLIQLCHQSDTYYDMLCKFYVKHARSPCRLQDRILVECLNGLLQLPGLAPVYIIVDGLDGCQATPCISGIPAPREKVLSLIRQLECIRKNLP